ncbi:MAG: hypothetical protein IPK64_17590 [bacterium]|nr:hypothetical protein [bacterium]
MTAQLTVCRSEWLTPQKRISISTSVGVAVRRAMVSWVSGEVALAAEAAGLDGSRRRS